MADAPFDPGTQARINQLLDLTTQRIARTDPLHQAALAMATRLAPTYARQAMTAPSSAPPINLGAAGGNSGGVPVAGTAIAAAMAALAKGGMSSGGDLGKLLEGLKRLFGLGNRSTVQGNQPVSGGALMGPNTTGAGYDMPSGVSSATGLPWQQPFLLSDPGRYTGFTGTPTDPSGGSGIGPGMQRYYGGIGDNSDAVDWWLK